MAVDRRAVRTAEAAVHKRAVAAVPTGFAVRRAVDHMAAETGADSIGVVAPAQDEEIGVTATGDMGTEAVDLGAEEEVCYTPTVLEGMVKMFHTNLGRQVAHKAIVVAHMNRDAVA